MTSDARRRRAIWQILLLSAGFLVLVAISTSSVLLVNKARTDSGLVVHTVEVEGQLSTLLLEIRRAESATRAYLLTSAPQFLAEYQTAAANILPAADKLAKLIWRYFTQTFKTNDVYFRFLVFVFSADAIEYALFLTFV